MIPTATDPPETAARASVSGLTRAFRWMGASVGASVAGAICAVIVLAPIVYGLLVFGIWNSYDQCGTATPPWSEVPLTSRPDRRLFPAELTCTFDDGSTLRVTLSGDHWTRMVP